MKGATTIAAGIDISANVKDALNGINKLSSGLDSVNTQLVDILKHFDDLNKKTLGNVTKNINSANYDFGSASHIVKNSKGSVITSPSGRNKAYKDYEQAIIEETKAVTDDTKERTRLRQQRADTEKRKTENEAARIAKMEDKTSALYLSNQTKIADAKLLNAKANQAGALNRNWRYQIGKAFVNMGDKAGTIGVGSDKFEGKIVGGALNIIGSLLKAPATGFGAALTQVTSVVTDFGKAVTTAYAEIEATKTQLGVVFSNQSEADSMFGEISKYAVKSPFGVKETSELAILLKQSGVYASDLMDTMKMLGDTAGGNMEKLKRIANNYAQIVSIGKASMLDMRQFAYAGIPIFEAVSKELKVSQSELRKLISDGKVTSEIVEKVFKDLTGVNGIFENATAKGAKTLKARLQNLSDAQQLAFGSIGESLYKANSKTGGDSLAAKILSTLENIYQHLHENVNTKNLENDVKIIKERETKIETLKQLIEKEKNNGNRANVKALEAVLSKEMSKIDLGEELSTKSRLYHAYSDSLMEQLDSDNLKTKKDYDRDAYVYGQIRQALSELKSGRIAEYGLLDKGYTPHEVMTAQKQLEYASDKNSPELETQRQLVKTWEDLKLTADKDINSLIQAMDVMAAAANDNSKALEAYSNVTEELRKASESDLAIKNQSSVYDTINKGAKESKSLYTAFQELASIYENSAEMQEKKENEKKKILLNALNELKEIKKHTDSDGKVDIKSFRPEDFSEYLEKKAFTAVRQLSVAKTGQSLQMLSDDRKARVSNLNYILSALKEKEGDNKGITSQSSGGKTAYNNVIRYLEKITDVRQSDDKFYKDLGGNLNSLKVAMSTLVETVDSSSDLGKFLKGVSALYNNSGLELEASVNANGLTEDVLKRSLSKEFIPLWKRQMAGITGLSANVINKPLEAIEAYQTNMSARNIASDVLPEILKQAGVSTVQSLTRTTGQSMTLKGTNTPIYQSDWKEFRENLKEFSTSLSSSTDVINAYTKGLEAERDALMQLLNVGITGTESQDIKGNQKLVSSKRMEEAMKAMSDSGEQLVSTFGDELQELESGRGVIWDENYKNEDGSKGAFVLLDENSKATKELARTLILSDSTYETVKLALEENTRELAKANSVKAKNDLLAGMYKDSEKSILDDMTIKSGASTDIIKLLMAHPEYRKAELSSAVSELKVSDKWKDSNIASKSESDIITLAANGDETAIQFMADATHKLNEEVSTFIKSEPYKEIKKLSESAAQLSAVNEANARLLDKRKNQENLPAESKETLIASLFGMNPAYTKERMVQMARTANEAGSAVNAFGIEGRTGVEWEKASDEDILKSLTPKEKLKLELEINADNAEEKIEELGHNIAQLGAETLSSGLNSTFETMGENLALSKDASDDLDKNLKQMGSDMLKNMGTMITQAGLSYAISNIGNPSGVMTGLLLAAAGGAASMLGGMLGAQPEDAKDKEEEDKLARLMKVKQDLSDLLKQAREDSIYYEKTVRHKNAISANENFKVRKVNDAIITPNGDVVTTHPDDYLIATKTPQTLVNGRGGGAPTVNFSVVDKSTGVRVTKQTAKYNEDTNTLDFEAIIESKVKQVIASSDGDEAFAMREARINGRNVVA